MRVRISGWVFVFGGLGLGELERLKLHARRSWETLFDAVSPKVGVEVAPKHSWLAMRISAQTHARKSSGLNWRRLRQLWGESTPETVDLHHICLAV